MNALAGEHDLAGQRRLSRADKSLRHEPKSPKFPNLSSRSSAPRF